MYLFSVIRVLGVESPCSKEEIAEKWGKLYLTECEQKEVKIDDCLPKEASDRVLLKLLTDK